MYDLSLLRMIMSCDLGGGGREERETDEDIYID